MVKICLYKKKKKKQIDQISFYFSVLGNVHIESIIGAVGSQPWGSTSGVI